MACVVVKGVCADSVCNHTCHRTAQSRRRASAETRRLHSGGGSGAGGSKGQTPACPTRIYAWTTYVATRALWLAGHDKRGRMSTCASVPFPLLLCDSSCEASSCLRCPPRRHPQKASHQVRSHRRPSLDVMGHSSALCESQLRIVCLHFTNLSSPMKNSPSRFSFHILSNRTYSDSLPSTVL